MKPQRRRAHDAPVVASLVLSMYVCITGFSGCYTVGTPIYDAAISASTTDVVSVTNGLLNIHNASATTNYSLSSIGCGSPHGDPDVQYDSVSGRWFFTQLAGTVAPNNPCGTSAVCLSVSTGTSPAPPYVQWYFDKSLFASTAVGVDQPRLSFTGNKVAISATTCGVGESATLILNKADLLAGQAVHTTVTHCCTFSHPARNLPGYNGLYEVGNPDGQSHSTLRIFVTTGVPGAGGVTTAYVDIPVGYDVFDPQPHTRAPDGWDVGFATPRNFHSAFNGALWALTNGENASGVPRLSLSEFGNLIPTFNPVLFQTMHQYAPDQGGGIGCEALAITAADDVVVGFDTVSSSRYISAYFTGRRHYDALNTIRAPVAVQAGSQPIREASHPTQRLDYCSADTDSNGVVYSVLQYDGVSASTFGGAAFAEVFFFDPTQFQ